MDRTVQPAEVQQMYDGAVRDRLPGVFPRTLRSTVCLYTVTPDSGFVIDRVPEMPQVWVASPCSGHGFKHSPALGEALAERVLTGKSARDVSAFALQRFAGRPRRPPPAPCNDGEEHDPGVHDTAPPR